MNSSEYSIEIVKKRVASVIADSKNKKPLKSSDQKWLYRKRIQFKNNPEKFSKEVISLLNTLSPYLQYDWRDASNFIERTQKTKIEEILKTLDKGQRLSRNQRNWFLYQKTLYQKNPDKLDRK